jgi:2-dehydropantoate 2-reductase
MKVCIVGAGAIGGLIGARLALAGATVSALARGETLAALRRDGWRLREGQAERQAAVQAEQDAAALGAQDLVIVAVKAPAMTEIAKSIAPLLGPRTVVLPAMNGVPWWFADGLQSTDPGGVIASAIPADRVVGCVVHLSAASPQPGLVVHGSGQGLIVGEPAGGVSERVTALGSLLSGAGFDVTCSPDVRREVWYKLWGNMTMNPVSALTGATGDRILDDPLVRAFCSAAMREAAEIGNRIGCPIAQDPEERHAVTRKLGAFRTSMLVDVERGRPIELDAIVTAVHELGRRTGVATPTIDAILGLTRLHGRMRGLYPD